MIYLAPPPQNINSCSSWTRRCQNRPSLDEHHDVASARQAANGGSSLPAAAPIRSADRHCALEL